MKTVLVTGGNRGIGKAIVVGLAQQGYKVLLGCRNLNAGEDVAKEIQGDIVPVALDLMDTSVLLSQIEDLLTQFPQIDILVNNAGVLYEGGVVTGDMAEMAETIQVNVMAPYILTKALVPGMQNRNFGRIVNLSSGWGSFSEGLAGPASYSISKAAINGLTVTLAKELSGDVTVNSMCPGWVHTRMGGEAAPRTPEQGAETAIWLASQDAGGPNGQFFRDKTPINW